MNPRVTSSPFPTWRVRRFGTSMVFVIAAGLATSCKLDWEHRDAAPDGSIGCTGDCTARTPGTGREGGAGGMRLRLSIGAPGPSGEGRDGTHVLTLGQRALLSSEAP